MTDKIKKAKANRDVYFNRLNEMSDLAKRAVQDEQFHTSFKMRFLGLEAAYKSFEKYHFVVVDLLANIEDADLVAEDAIRINADNYYYFTLTTHNNLFEQKNIACSRNQNPSVKLPKITIPVFKGQIKSWPNFYDLFVNLIDKNTSLTNVEKFQYLISSLAENVLPIVSGLPVTDNNYPIALDTLVKRFQNKRILATHYWKAIYDLEKLNTNSAHKLRALLDSFCENLDALTNLNFPTDEWDFIMFNMLLQKLDQDTVKRFELEYSCIEIPSFKLLKDFLLKQCIALDSLALSSTSSNNNRPYKQKNSNGFTTLIANSSKCSFCNQSHFITNCQEFLKKTPNEKYVFAKESKLCINCLKSSHSTPQCDSTYSCKKCQFRHHTLLHFPPRNNPNTPQSNLSALGVFRDLDQSLSTVLLSTIQIDVLDSRGNVQICRALLDSASQTSFISEQCFRRLGLPKIKSNISVQGLGQHSSNVSGLIECTIFPKCQINPVFKVDTLIIPKICSPMPAFHLDAMRWPHISNIKLADDQFHVPGNIDLLLGADIFSNCILSGRIVGSVNEPIALETLFGWVLMGKVSSPSTSLVSLCATSDSSLDGILRKFWEVEEPPQKISLSADDVQCENNFVETHFRTESGRYCVSLPFRYPNPTFQENKSLALRRFLNLERRLLQNPDLYTSYSEFMQDYLDSGHMTAVQDSINDGKMYFIPHHAVLRPESCTTKLRVVFDASAKTYNDLSLNEKLLTGPKLQKNIVTILLNFRIHKYVLTADIKQMYRQILVKAEHRPYQKILWRFSNADPIKEYCLNTVTYGVSSAPFLALRTIQQLVKDEGHLYPLASKALSSDIFVDDILTSCESIVEARALRDELIQMLDRGGFQLRKWASNDSRLLADIPESSCISKILSLDMETDSFIKILGLQWHPLLDSFSFKVIPQDEECTKRGILSQVAKIYDPTGYLSPIVFYSKYLISQLWAQGLGWDERPAPNFCSKWSLFRSQLPLLSKISIPRQIIDTSSVSFQLHGFADASEKGYAGVIYIRTIDSNNFVHINLLIAKSKVAPLKRITLPRLELCAAVLLSELLAYVLEVYQHINFQVFAWSDSMVTLSWLKSSPHRWKCFVSNRVSRIQEHTSPSIWHHVRSEDNPADCASRGLMPAEFINNSLWWAGPKWLSEHQENWPQLSNIFEPSMEVEEEQRKIVLNITIENDFPAYLIYKYSSLSKIKRIIAYYLRFIHNIQNPNNKRSGPVIDFELYRALTFLVKVIQAKVFSVDLSNLHQKKSISKPLRKLAPFLDEDGVLRVGGRLSNSSLQYDKKYPILLPRSHRLTELIIEDFHKNNLHPGLQTLQFLILQQFWILSARRAIRSVLSKCVSCYKINPKPVEPRMGDLPSLRVNQVKPFSCTGVDMAGPFLITMSKRRGSRSQKAYLCLFVCFATKAVHLEVTSDLSTESFLAALQRFVARRGRCNTLFSDQGTNFIGAHTELLKHMQNAAQHEKIKWTFNPPSAPHFGGLWEAGVKSVKTHFFRIVGNQILTYEEIYTVFVKIEAILNSRPLCSISSDPSDFSALTPGHFLVLEPLTTVPSSDLTHIQLNRLDRWQLIQRMTQDFWKRWHQEYLHSLQQRSKWNKSSRAVEENMLVLIKNENLPPLQWRLARIIELHKGKDGICRVCTVKTSQGTLKRPVVKLCPLPIY